jgi:hypothetical protein
MLGSFAIAGFFGNIAFIIDSINEKSNEKAYNLESLNAKLNYRKIPPQFSIMAMEYAAFMHEKKSILSTLDCVKDLSIELQKEIQKNLHSYMISKIPIFQKLHTIEIVWLINHLEVEVFIPEETIHND